MINQGSNLEVMVFFALFYLQILHTKPPFYYSAKFDILYERLNSQLKLTIIAVVTMKKIPRLHIMFANENDIMKKNEKN